MRGTTLSVLLLRTQDGEPLTTLEGTHFSWSLGFGIWMDLKEHSTEVKICHLQARFLISDSLRFISLRLSLSC